MFRIASAAINLFRRPTTLQAVKPLYTHSFMTTSRMHFMTSKASNQFSFFNHTAMLMGVSPMRNFSMVLRKRPKCVAVNKYKLKTKKAAQYRISIVSNRVTCRLEDCETAGSNIIPKAIAI